MTLTEKTTPQAPPEAPPSRDAANWAKPVDRLSAEGVVGAGVDSVTGKRVNSPLQGFGQLWQKTFRVTLEGSTMSPQEVIAIWKERFATFWPKKGRFYAPLAGIVPGEVALLDIAPLPGAPVKFSTGVMVIYADDESFTFISPEGHMLSGWITFSAYRDGDVTVAQVQALERTSDPFDELGRQAGNFSSSISRITAFIFNPRAAHWVFMRLCRLSGISIVNRLIVSSVRFSTHSSVVLGTGFVANDTFFAIKLP